MNIEEQNAEKLWRYLKIQDEHLLIRISSLNDKTERVLIVEKDEGGELRFDDVKIPPSGFNEWVKEYKQPFTLVQQRDENGCFFVPDINKWIMDEQIDY